MPLLSANDIIRFSHDAAHLSFSFCVASSIAVSSTYEPEEKVNELVYIVFLFRHFEQDWILNCWLYILRAHLRPCSVYRACLS